LKITGELHIVGPRDPLPGTPRWTKADDEIVLSQATVAADVAGWDSLANVRLMIATERTFGIKFTAAEIGNMKNVGDLDSADPRQAGKELAPGLGVVVAVSLYEDLSWLRRAPDDFRSQLKSLDPKLPAVPSCLKAGNQLDERPHKTF
jgi:acyl carrier protein